MLSLILYGRNDNYGYNLHKRAALSLNCMAELLTAHDDEIIFVDYNTPDDFPTFPEAIQDTLTERAKRLLRILRVRPSQHERFSTRTHLIALEPVARNVALRRMNSANRWVLSTNTDMIFVPRRGRSLSGIAETLPNGYYHLPRFEVPESLWESLNWLDPGGAIAAVGSWGRDFHLNEIVEVSDPAVRYDGPGDFQLMLGEDLWRIHGFHELMLLGWHVDSNVARRLFLLHGRVGDVIEDMFGYHCDHTRQVTPAHRPGTVQNDMETFVTEVTDPHIPEQAASWGLADELVEELRADTTSRLYLAGLHMAIPEPAGTTLGARYAGDSYNRMDYATEHVIPFALDVFASYGRGTMLGWCGAKPALLQCFAAAWRDLGFSAPIMVAAEAHWLGPELPDACVWAGTPELASRCDAFVFDWGMPDIAATTDEWQFDTDPVMRAVVRSFRLIVRAEQVRLRARSAIPRRFICINAVNTQAELVVSSYIGAARSPIATRIRQGYCTDLHYEFRDLLSVLHAGGAGRRNADTDAAIVAVPGVAGHIFYGGYLDLPPGNYQFTLELDHSASREFDSGDIGLGLEMVSGPYLLGYRPVGIDDLERGRISVGFCIAPSLIDSLSWLGIEFRLRTAGQANVTIRGAVLTETEAQEAEDISGFDWLPLLSVGPAGRRRPAPSGVAVPSASAASATVIQAMPGINEAVAYGPSAALLPGRYQAIFELYFLDAPDGTVIRADVVTDSGNRYLAEQRIAPINRSPVRCVLPFSIPDEALTAPDHLPLEFRIWSCGKANFCLTSLRVAPVDVNTRAESVVSSYIGAARSPIATRIRQGYCTDLHYEFRDLLSVLHAGGAGRRNADTDAAIVAVPGVAGHIFYGGYLDLPPGNYQFTLELDHSASREFDSGDIGLGLEMVSGPYLLGYRPVGIDDLERGRISVGFCIAPSLIDSLSWFGIEFRLRTAGQANVTIRGAVLTETEAQEAEDISGFDWLPLLSVGPAGRRRPAPSGVAVPSASAASATVIQAMPGINEAVVYGPYAALLPGRYHATFELYFADASDAAAIRADVVTDSGNRLLAEERIVPTSPGPLRCVLGFVIPEEALMAPDHLPVEFRVWTCGRANFWLSSLRVAPAEPVAIES